MSTLPVRLIARLDIKGPNLVKGVNLEGLRVLGRSEEFAEYYYEQGIDELFYMDVVASLYGRNSLAKMISELAKRVFIPLTVGGGIRTIEDINNVLRAGADKVCINTAAIKNPEFIKKAVKQFGASTIVIAIEAIAQAEGKYLAYVDNGREFTGVEVVAWARQLNEIGVGELVLTSVDKEGTGEGFDIKLVEAVASEVNIPVVAHGGAGSIADVVKLFTEARVSAVALASILHYGYLAQNVAQNNYLATEGNFNFLKSKAGYSRIKACGVPELKQALMKETIFCRV